MEDISLNVFGLSTMCRLCLSSGVATLNIFDFSTGLMNQVADVIMKCAPIQITRCDEMPNFICQICYTQLEKSYQFQMRVVQTDKTLRRNLHQLRTSNKQIITECSIQRPSKDPLIRNTNTNITMKSESLEIQDVFYMNVNMKQEVPSSYTLAYKIKEKSIDDKSIPTECTNNSIDTLSKGDDDIVIRYKNSEIEEQIEKFTGLYCEREDGNKKTLADHKNHEISNKMKYKCDILYNHKKAQTGEKLYHCDVCNKCFSDSTNLRIHQRLHTDRNQYQCDVCNKCFSILGNLKKHQRLHTGEKPYQCNICNKCFSILGNLKKHQRVHTGEKPYQCDVCNKCFSILGNLTKHQRVHNGEKRYQCDICNKSFSQLSSLNSHKRKHYLDV